MFRRLFIVLVLGGALVIAASWNSDSNSAAANSARHSDLQDHVIMTVTIEPERTPSAPAPIPPVGHSSRQRMIAQN
jgi:hypothetical protein